jgi:hypothetical protein
MSVDMTDRRFTYSLRVYCDSPGCATFEEIIGKTQQGCLRRAEREGWTVTKNRLFTACPACTKKLTAIKDIV